MNDPTIVVAGAVGNLGGRIARALRERGARVRGLVRPGTANSRLQRLREHGVEIAGVGLEGAACERELGRELEHEGQVGPPRVLIDGAHPDGIAVERLVHP